MKTRSDRPRQIAMFPLGEDLPLFSLSPILVEESRFAPLPADEPAKPDQPQLWPEPSENDSPNTRRIALDIRD